MNHINFEPPLQIFPNITFLRYGWLRAIQQQKQAIRKRSKRIPLQLRYFTFWHCAEDAIDVFMLEREEIHKRSEETGARFRYLEGVYHL